MYHPDVVAKRIFQARKAGIPIMKRSREESLEISSKLEKLRYKNGLKLPPGQLVRDLDAKELTFTRSERALCKADFIYYLIRYHTIERDPGVGSESGVGPATLLESQVRFITMLGRRELVCHEEQKRFGHTQGIRVYAHKCRQVVFTTTCRALCNHRRLFYPGTRSLAAALTDGPKGTGELYKRDLLNIDNLPFWLKPDEIYPNVKDEEIGFPAPLNCRVSYQAENQQVGIGTGSQVDVSHLTEVPLWSYPYRIRFSFLPSIPKAISTLHIQEATSAGKGGYWQEVSEGCRQRRKGFEDYIYIFVPVYLNKTKYRAVPPDDWVPDEHTLQYVELVERTSPEFNDGVAFHPNREHLYWWETERAVYSHNGELALFLANYPATPEQSFSNWAQGALPAEVIEKMDMECRIPHPYSVTVEAA